MEEEGKVTENQNQWQEESPKLGGKKHSKIYLEMFVNYL